ncbi:hypothetical protein AVEN_30226-1 [Araneus ventricosus]|uniref:CRAL-TRIO domain-containing protein n=1 Tax=Araneus ventricosus TaxID=182803 RepID=A0A4Y2UZQ5_ARAVE|nr:hypothetical protein AVEN_30226-1 [Araneus ventricosus]
MGKWDPDEFPLEEFKRLFVFIFLQALRCPMTQINGFKIINDYTGTNLKHLKVCTPQNLYLEYHIAYQCVPGRYKEVHFVNGSAMLALIWSMAKHVLSKKIKERVIIHSKPEDLLNYFPADILPAPVGGKLTDYHDANLMGKMNRDHGNYPIGGPPNYF